MRSMYTSRNGIHGMRPAATYSYNNGMRLILEKLEIYTYFIYILSSLRRGDGLTTRVLLLLTGRAIAQVRVFVRSSSRALLARGLGIREQLAGVEAAALPQCHHSEQFFRRQETSPLLQTIFPPLCILQIRSELAAMGSLLFLQLDQGLDVRCDLLGLAASRSSELREGSTAARGRTR